jgi:hypothetical protein
LILLLALLAAPALFADEKCPFLEEFHKTAKGEGIQIGVVIDSRGSEGAYGRVAEFDAGNPIALAALKKVASVTTLSYGQLGDLITAIDDRSGGGGKMWFYFKWNGRSWEPSKEGVSSRQKGQEALPLPDGSVIGFVLSQVKGGAEPTDKPSCPRR